MPSQDNPDSDESSVDHDKNTPDTSSRTTTTDSNETDKSTEITLDDIPRTSARSKAVDVLETLDELGGDSDTTELRKHSGRSSDEIKYQYKILGKELDRGLGLLHTWMPEDWDGTMPIPPKRVELTEKGITALENGFLEGSTDIEHDTDTRIENLTARANALESQLDEYKDLVETLFEVLGVPKDAEPGEHSIVDDLVKQRKGGDAFENILIREGMHPQFDEPQEFDTPSPEDYINTSMDSEDADEPRD